MTTINDPNQRQHQSVVGRLRSGFTSLSKEWRTTETKFKLAWKMGVEARLKAKMLNEMFYEFAAYMSADVQWWRKFRMEAFVWTIAFGTFFKRWTGYEHKLQIIRAYVWFAWQNITGKWPY